MNYHDSPMEDYIYNGENELEMVNYNQKAVKILNI